jgi:branched-chain amino acid transport system permease protein
VRSLPVLRSIRKVWETDPRQDPNPLVYTILTIGAIAYPIWAQISTGGQGDFLISVLADAGVYILLAIGLNVVVGFAGLLDLGYAAFFAIGAYTYAFLASEHLIVTPLGMAIHLPFWIVLLVGMFVAAGFGLILGAPTLRLRGDYLAIVTLGFGEIVPRVFKNLATWTSGVNGISALDKPVLPVWLQGPWSGDPLQFVQDFKIISPLAFYVVMVILLGICVVLVNNLRRSRVGRAWMAVREDEVAAAAMGVNTVRIKLLAFAIGAAFSGFAGAFYGAKLSLVSPENFGFSVSITILVMIVLGGMGNIPGVIIGSLLIYGIIFLFLPALPPLAEEWATSLGLGGIVAPSGEWPGIGQEIQRLKFLFFGLILVLTMLLRPQGLIPSRVRKQELTHGVHEDQTIEDVNAETTA